MLKLSKPYIPEESFDLVKQIMESGNLVQGKAVLELESLLAEYLKVKNVVLVSSGTAALHIALVALDIKKGDEVIVPAYSFPAVANAVELAGATPIFVDIKLDDYCIDADKIAEKITERTKAIMPVHEFGQAANMDEIVELAKAKGLYIIEDAACAIGTEYNNTKAGTIGDVGCFSFHPRKILTTGEGGAVVTNNSKLADKIRKLRNHGMQYAENKFDFVLPGFNYRITDFQAAMAIPQLKVLSKTIEIHRAQAEIYNNFCALYPEISIDANFENRYKTYQTYHLMFKNETARNFVKEELQKQGIETNIGAYCIPTLSYYKDKYKLNSKDYPQASAAYTQGLALPIGRHLNNENLKHITQSISSILTWMSEIKMHQQAMAAENTRFQISDNTARR